MTEKKNSGLLTTSDKITWREGATSFRRRRDDNTKNGPLEWFVLWVYPAHDKDKLWAFVNMVMDFQGLIKYRKFLEHLTDNW